MAVLLIVGLAASHAAPRGLMCHVEYALRALLRLEKYGTDRWTDRQADGRKTRPA